MASTSRKRSSAAASGIDIDDSSKRAKTNTERKPTATNARQTDSAVSSKVDANGDRYWEISKMRRVTVSRFRGKTMVNIREYYEKDGQELPGKKGISMQLDQFSAVITFLPEIEAVLRESGESIPRPDYSGASNMRDESDEAEGDPGGDSKDIPARQNIDATSDEDEDDE